MVWDFRIYFYIAQKLEQLNQSFTSTGVKDLIKSKYYSAVDMVFSFIAAFAYRATGYSDEPTLSVFLAMYSNSNYYLMFKSFGVRGIRIPDNSLKENIQKLKVV